MSKLRDTWWPCALAQNNLTPALGMQERRPAIVSWIVGPQSLLRDILSGMLHSESKDRVARR